MTAVYINHGCVCTRLSYSSGRTQRAAIKVCSFLLRKYCEGIYRQRSRCVPLIYMYLHQSWSHYFFAGSFFASSQLSRFLSYSIRFFPLFLPLLLFFLPSFYLLFISFCFSYVLLPLYVSFNSQVNSGLRHISYATYMEYAC